MAILFFTDRPFQIGTSFDTRDFCDENLDAIRMAGPVVKEVEAFLEEYRLEHLPEAPQRFCSISVIPWPTYAPATKASSKMTHRPRVILPESLSRFCYAVAPKADSRHWLADERWVDKLLEEWNRLRKSAKLLAEWHRLRKSANLFDLAATYWRGIPWGIAPISVLIEGPVFVEEECIEGEVPFELPGPERVTRPRGWGVKKAKLSE